MKNLNLIKWLWDDSHEKQSPQRFARYAVMMMLLTLGVGQMWAASVSTGQMFFADLMNCGNFKDGIYVLFKFWNGASCTEVQGVSAGSDLWYCTIPAGANGATKVSLQRCNSTFSQKWNETSQFSIESGKDVVQPSESDWSWTSATMYASTTIYATPSTMSLSQWGAGKNFRANVKIGDDNYIQFRMSSTGKNYNGEPIYKCQYFSTWGGWHLIQFQVYDGDSWKEQKVYDKTTAGWDYAGAKTNSANKIFNGSSWVAYNYDVTITFNMNGHGSAPSNITLLKGGKASAPSDPSASGYDFGGWYTDSKCTSAWSWSTAVNEDKILYAKWTESALPSVSLDATKTTGINVGETITLTATGANASNITKYEFYEGETKVGESTAPTNTFSYTPTTVGNKTVKVVMTYNSGSNTVTSSNVALTLNTPSVALAVKAGSSDEIYLGETTTTMKATPSNVGGGVTPSYTFTDQATSPVSSGAQANTEWTYTPGVTGTKTMKVTMSVGGATYTATTTVKVYEHWNIYVHDVQGWGKMSIYSHTAEAHGTWPGTACSKYNGSNSWYEVTLDSKSTSFILNKNGEKSGDNDIKTKDLTTGTSSGTYAAGTYWYINSYTGGSLVSVSVSNPTVTLSASVANCKDITLNGSVTNFGGDGTKASDMKEVYFQVGGIKQSAGTISSSNGTFSKTISSATAGATNTLQAFAENIHGTGSSSSLHYTNVTLNPQSGADGTTSVTAVENTAMPAGATAPSKTGYTFDGYYAYAGGSGKKYYTNTMASVNTWDQTTKDATIHAKWTPITYTVKFNGNGATSGEMSDQTGIAYDAATTLTANAFVKTGYTFAGWATTAEKAAEGTVDRTDGAAHDNLSSTQGATVNLYAVWTPKQSALSFDYQTSATGYGAGGSIAAVSATYDAAMPSLTGTLPTAANGYAFMGFYDAEGGAGTQYYDGTGASVTNWDKDTGSGTTLYAYYKKAEITTLALSAGTVLPKGSVTATATIEPTPTGDTHIDWKLLYNNNTEYSPQPSGLSSTARSVTFTVPEASGTYKVQAQLRTGSECGAGTLLSERTTSFVVAGTHTVTIQYKCGDQVIKTATTREGVMPLTWSELITAPNDIFGYTFDHWEAGDGVTIRTNGSSAIDGTTTTEAEIYIKAIYDGRLTAVYTKKNIIYFKNTLGWSEVYVNLYPYAWWSSTKGAGNQSLADEKRNKQMTQLGETDIWYYEYGNTATTAYVSFTDRPQNNYEGFAGASGSNKVQVSYPTRPDATKAEDTNYGFNAGTPMFVPIVQTAQPWNKSGSDDLAEYYNKGYWRAYDPTTGESGSTGYTLKIYNQTEGNSSRKLLQSIPFTNADASGQIFKATAGLNAAGGYGIKVERDNSLMYTNITGHLHRTGEVVAMSVNPDDYKAIYILTTAAGDYDFIITCNGSGQLCLQATFPAAKDDYRVLYTDNATWSNTAHTPRTWFHPSRVISAEAGATDTISFFVSKDNSPEYKIQKVSSINEGTGAITWTDVTSWKSISVDKTGVYNFIFTQPSAGSISLSKTEAYTGNYYIRTDNAGSTKWENYREEDHKMTYSEYAAKITHTGEEWKDFTHYFMKYVDKDTEDGKYKNVNFTVANDYSPCISDTLVQQTGDTDITPNHVNDAGDLQASANIRFMWNIKNNKLQRAYLAAAQTDGSKFLVLQGESGKLLAPDGTALSDANGNNHRGGTDAIQFTDKEHWMYEAEVKAVPGGRVKLYAVFNGRTFYYYGDEDAEFTGTSAIDLVTGDDEEAQTIRVVYDFKTDRLMAAWVPSDGDINAPQTINADIMLIREHQNAGKQINLKGSGSIKTNKTVYGVLRFNRWILNNKSTESGHAVLPVDEQKSQYERFNYMISFPFDVKVGEIFGFGTIGRHYRIYYYDGLGRAQEGFFAERGDDNWRMIDDTDSILHANQGYLLQLNYIRMADNNTETWPQTNMNEVELYFPAMNEINTISLDDVTIPALGDAYNCKINLQPIYKAQGNPKADEADRRVKDSYWRCIGVPGFTSYEFNADTSVNFNWKAEAEKLPYLYEWHMDDNKLSVVSSSTFTFKPMHAYLIQNGNSFTWSSVAVPSKTSIVARRQAPASEDGYYEFYLEMQNGEQALDHTYVRLTDKENITADFDFGQDLSKELNSGANIFTKVGYERLAANNLPLSEQTTIIPVGVTTAEEGYYTFSMPEGTHGIGVTLVDNETGDRTNLSLFDYSVNLTKGDYANRFILEISPIQQMPTNIDNVQGESAQSAKARKVMIDGILYIVKDGKVFDAQGKRLQ